MSGHALLLVGFQNDYFDAAGALSGFLEPQDRPAKILERTSSLVERALDLDVVAISTPIRFTPDYSELVEPVGILAEIVARRAFGQDSFGGATVSAMERFGSRVLELPGKRGLDAFSNTRLDAELRERGVREVALTGVLTSLCIDSTARTALELGYSVSILEDCTGGRTAFEQEYFCGEIFPMFARVESSEAWLERASKKRSAERSAH